jgi:hypothetical protein
MKACSVIPEKKKKKNWLVIFYGTKLVIRNFETRQNVRYKEEYLEGVINASSCTSNVMYICFESWDNRPWQVETSDDQEEDWTPT